MKLYPRYYYIPESSSKEWPHNRNQEIYWAMRDGFHQLLLLHQITLILVDYLGLVGRQFDNSYIQIEFDWI